MAKYSAGVGSKVILQNAATTGNGDVAQLSPNLHNSRLNIRGAGTVTGGTISVEESSDPDYTGTWSVITTITASTLTGGKEQVVHIAGSLGSVRTRISSDITGGGTVSSEFVGG